MAIINFNIVPKTYKMTTKKVTLPNFNNREYEATMVSNHSRVKGIIWRSFDKNASDAWANIRMYIEEIHVLWKDKNDWEKLYYGVRNACKLPYNISSGMGRLLFSMEKPRIQGIWIRKQQIQEVKELIEQYKITASELFDKE